MRLHDILFNITSIAPISIGFPNRSETIAYYEGGIFVSSTLLLTNMLYVPILKCNFISISQQQNQYPSYYVGIFYGTCVIHYHTTSVNIGMGSLVNGVYHFPQVQACYVSISSFDFLHRRLEHLSSFAMNKLKDVFFGSNNALTTCTICRKLS